MAAVSTSIGHDGHSHDENALLVGTCRRSALFELEAAVDAAVRVFDEQEQQREQAGKRRTDDGNQYSPKWGCAFQDAGVMTTRTQNGRNDRPRHRWLWRRLKILRWTVTLRLAVWRRNRGNVARWSGSRLSERFRTVAAEIRPLTILSSAARTLHLV